MYNRDSEIDMEMVAAFLKNAVNKIKTQENPDLLNDLKKVFKKNVPLTMRSYVAAYLIKEAQRGKSSFRSRRDFHENKHKPQRERPQRERKVLQEEFRPTTEERPVRTRIQIDPTVASTIFISIGRNRRVFPRDLVGLLASVAGLEREKIGDIRVLANYSFVQLFTEDAEKAINTLNGYDYRGRKLVVSYSKLKEDGESFFTSQEDGVIQNDEDAQAYALAEKAAANNEPFSAPHISSEQNSQPESYL